MNEEELYEQYHGKMRQLEEKREEYEWKRRRFNEDKEEAQAEIQADRIQMEELLNTWGDCHESGVLLSEFEESVEKEYQELQEQEEELQNEHKEILAEIACCEERYQSELKQLQEEESCQE